MMLVQTEQMIAEQFYNLLKCLLGLCKIVSRHTEGYRVS